jgi:hypothetical protein
LRWNGGVVTSVAASLAPPNHADRRIVHSSNVEFHRIHTRTRARSTPTKLTSKTPDFIGPKDALKPDRPWRQIAGPVLTASQLHCATLPEGEIADGKPTWDGGSYERIAAQNRKALRAHFAKPAEEAEIEADGYFTDPEWHEVISPDGVLSYVTCFQPPVKNVSGSQRHVPDDLSIPPFLDRRPEQLREAAHRAAA